MSERNRDDAADQRQRRGPEKSRARLVSPRAEALGSGRQYRWTERAEDPFDMGRYWEIYAGTD